MASRVAYHTVWRSVSVTFAYVCISFVPSFYLNCFLSPVSSSIFICCMAIRLGLTILSGCAIPSLMNAAFTFSMLDSQISSLMVAESRISPFFSGVSSRHFLAVIPNIAMFGTSASLVYFMTACPRVTSGGMRLVLMASV